MIDKDFVRIHKNLFRDKHIQGGKGIKIGFDRLWNFINFAVAKALGV